MSNHQIIWVVVTMTGHPNIAFASRSLAEAWIASIDKAEQAVMRYTIHGMALYDWQDKDAVFPSGYKLKTVQA